MTPVQLTGNDLNLGDLVAIARHDRTSALAPQARQKMQASQAWVQQAASGAVRDARGQSLPVYGVNTGYGSLARVRISEEKTAELSWNLIRSHAAGVGSPVPADVTRAMMLLRANALAKGVSGCRPQLVETLTWMLNKGVTPWIPCQGSCGSSGDLAPLCHLGLVVFKGETESPEESGHAWWQGELLTGNEAMTRAGLARFMPGPKEGLAMSNGAQLTTAYAALACHDAEQLVLLAEVAAAMSWEALRGVSAALHAGVHQHRPYAGALRSAAHLRFLLQGSSLVDSLVEKVQDAYSLRCTPVVLGAVRDTLTFATQQVGIEINSATDNPLILQEEEGWGAFSAGLFHGEPVGMACDHLKLALCELAALAERRLYRLTTGTLSARLPPLLIRKDKPHMGLMAHQITAASLIGENRALAYPASADSIPTCEDQEDHVAMSTTAARRLCDVLNNAQYVIAIEMLCAARGLLWRQENEDNITFGKGSQAAVDFIRDRLGSRLTQGSPSEQIEALKQSIDDESLLTHLQAHLGSSTEWHHG